MKEVPHKELFLSYPIRLYCPAMKMAYLKANFGRATIVLDTLFILPPMTKAPHKEHFRS